VKDEADLKLSQMHVETDQGIEWINEVGKDFSILSWFVKERGCQRSGYI
jgi:hypothetical protein